MGSSVRVKGNRVNVLFTCIGRRVSLLRAFQRAARQLGLRSDFVGTDCTELSAALQLCDKKYVVRPISKRGYIDEILDIVRRNRVRLLVPTIDTELLLLAENKGRFSEVGCHVLVSEPRAVEIAQDKRKTYKFLVQHGFGAPETMSVETALERGKTRWPCLMKPWDGSASKGVTVVRNRQELRVFSKRIPNCIVQEFIEGTEYTCDVYVDFQMRVRCVVPRRRIEVRGGEVSKGQTAKIPEIMRAAAELAEVLGGGPGVITLQLMLTRSKEIRFIEINPRFGGGAPLSIKAGANFPKWILQELTGQQPRIKFSGFKECLTMLRYDAAVWT